MPLEDSHALAEVAAEFDVAQLEEAECRPPGFSSSSKADSSAVFPTWLKPETGVSNAVVTRD